MDQESRWRALCAVIEARRAVRDFAPAPVEAADLRAIIELALLSPTSSNLQLYRLHVVTDPALRATLAHACMNQRAARTAPVLIAVACCPREVSTSLAEQRRALAAASQLGQGTHEHAVAHLTKLQPVLGLASHRLLAPMLRVALWAARQVRPTPELSTGDRALREWTMRNSAFAVQTLMLAAEAQGYATCPMEGFDPQRVARALGLRHERVWLMLALGRRADGARVDARWRRPFSTMVRIH